MLSHIIAITFLLNPVGQDSDAKIKQGLKALSSHGARLQRLKYDFAGSKTEESRKEKHTELKNAVAQFEKMLISAHRSKVIDASQAGRELEAAWYLLAGVTRDLGDISAAEALIARCLTVSEGTHLVVKRLVTQAFYHAKTDQKKTIKQLEAIRSTKGFMKGSVLKGREERDVLRHLAWLYTQTGDTQKAVDIYEQYFQWFIDTRASIDAVELKNWHKYKLMLNSAKSGLTDPQRNKMEKDLIHLREDLIERESFQTELQLASAEEDEVLEANFKKWLNTQGS